jgi:hypothetical protein
MLGDADDSFDWVCCGSADRGWRVEQLAAQIVRAASPFGKV